MAVTSPSTNDSLAVLGEARALYDCGAFAEAVDAAKTIYQDSEDNEMRFRAILLASSGESEQRHYATALKTLQLADPLLDEARPVWKANYFCQRAHLKVRLNPKVVDCAVIDYQAAIFYAQEADDSRVEARARNNLARRHSKANRFDDAIREVDAAIRIADRLGERVELGRFYDQKAQILIDHRHFAEATRFSERAISLLNDHPSQSEARTTYGLALVALGAEFLEQEDPIDTFTSKRQAVKYVSMSLDASLIQLALDRASGNISHASDLLHVKHTSLLELIKKFKLTRSPVRRRGRTYNKK